MAASRKFTYPETRKVNVVEDFHGTPVADPYRWLEDPDAPDTAAWVDAQNAVTFGYLESIPARETLRKRLTELWNFPKYFPPKRRGSRYFYLENDGLKNQPLLYMREGLEGEPQLILDPNTLSSDGTVALMNAEFSRDGRLLAYALSESGSDWQVIRVRDIDSGSDYDEVLGRCKFATIAWHPDGSGFYYNGYPQEGEVPESEMLVNNRIYFHIPGTPQAEDVLVYENPAMKAVSFNPEVTDDGQYLVMTVSQTLSTNRIYYRPLASDEPFIPLIDRADGVYFFVGNEGRAFYFQTNVDAPRGRVIAVDLDNPAPENWQVIIPEGEGVLSSIGLLQPVTMVNNQLVVVSMQDAVNRVHIHNLDGSPVREVELPALGTVVGLTGGREDKEMFLHFHSFLYAPSVFRYDFESETLMPYRQPEIDFDPTAYETRQVFYPSKDGTQVPMFITHKKGLELDGNNPTLMYAYGGFSISLTPPFSIPALVWLENGGIYALPNLRGGGEYGEDWHRAGMLEKKQNVFDDFISAGEWLVQNHYTRPEKLAIEGGSNGGLLVGACMTQRPDLFGAVICQVPVADMLRYHKFTVGSYWIPEYGNAEADAEQFRLMYAYSPLHNVRPGTTYPATLITTADHDDRVVPMHAEKFAATLQAADSGQNPVLIRIETKAGHGQGKPTAKMIDEAADIFAFLHRALHIE